jgi:hypothetical protein
MISTPLQNFLIRKDKKKNSVTPPSLKNGELSSPSGGKTRGIKFGFLTLDNN